MRKTRLSFSSVSIEPVHPSGGEKKPAREFRSEGSARQSAGGGQNMGGRKKLVKSSTYQYSKKNYRQSRGNRSFTGKSGYTNTNESKIPSPSEGVVRIIPLGGVEEIGKNMTAIEIDNDIIIIDAGMHFSNEETPGVDYVIPNTTYLEEHKEKIRALIITHGHLDHIGGVPVVLSRIGNPPVYSRKLSILLMRKRQAEFPQLPAMKENIVEKDSVITCGKIKIKFFGVMHTVPDSMGIIIETKNGWIVNPGDYKLDQVNGVVTSEEEKEYSIFNKAKVLLLMTDSTNVENEGFALPEIKVHQGLENLIKKINGRIIIAAFASHITRLAFIVKVAETLGKKAGLDIHRNEVTLPLLYLFMDLNDAERRLLMSDMRSVDGAMIEKIKRLAAEKKVVKRAIQKAQ